MVNEQLNVVRLVMHSSTEGAVVVDSVSMQEKKNGKEIIILEHYQSPCYFWEAGIVLPRHCGSLRPGLIPGPGAVRMSIWFPVQTCFRGFFSESTPVFLLH